MLSKMIIEEILTTEIFAGFLYKNTISYPILYVCLKVGSFIQYSHLCCENFRRDIQMLIDIYLYVYYVNFIFFFVAVAAYISQMVFPINLSVQGT